MDGIDDPDAAEDQRLGVAPLHPSTWFNPPRSQPAHTPAAAGRCAARRALSATLEDMDVAIGVRCWKDRIAFVALSNGDADRPNVVLHRRIKIPVGSSDGERVVWVHKAAVEAVQEVRAAGVAVRVSDNAHADQTRAEHEGVVLLAAALNNLPAIILRRQSMLKPLGVERTAGAWAEFQRTDPFLLGFVADERDAAMAARALLSRGPAR